MTEVVVERLGLHGDGIASGPIYVPRTLPGEKVSGDVVDGRIAKPKITTPSPHRIAPPCRHYKSCGGCALQHATNDVVSRFKTEVLQAALTAQGIATDIALVHTSPPGSRRRATLSGRRTKSGAVVGFHAPQSDVLTGIEDCLVVSPPIRELIPVLQSLVRAFGSRRGEMRFAVTDTESGIDLDISGPDRPEASDLAAATDLARAAGLARLTWSGEVVAQFVRPCVKIEGVDVSLPPRAFLQATKPAEQALIDEVLAGLAGVDGSVIDLFSGVGTFTLPAASSRSVHAVEADGAALDALNEAWRMAKGLQKVTVEARDLFRRPILSDQLSDFSAAILDPPRAGAAEQIKEIAESDLCRIVHVSCNPVTFARDAATLLAAGFAMSRVSVVDQFRWSPHIEMVSTFSR